LLRWANLRQSANIAPEEAKLLVRLLLWLPHTDTGDRSELRLGPEDERTWARLSAEHEACLATPCVFAKDGSCFLLRARKQAEAAHVLVVNHALLLSDLAVGGGVIPEYGRLIIDEAQHLEEEATRQFGFRASEEDVVTMLDGVSSRGSGLVASLRAGARGMALQLADVRAVLDQASRAERAVEQARRLVPELFLRLAGFLRQQAEGAGDYEDRLLLTRAVRVQPDWADVEVAWDSLNGGLAEVSAAVEGVYIALQAPDASTLLDHERLAMDAADVMQEATQLRAGLAAIIAQDDPKTVCWLSQTRTSTTIMLSSAPLQVADLLEERLFSRKDTVVLTSATLTSEGSFEYVRNCLGLDGAEELQLGSPFDYSQSTMVLAPTDMPEPSQPGYMAALQQSLIELTRATEGRALVLFTAHGALRAAYAGIKEVLEREQILVLAHQIDGTPKQLAQALRDQPRTVVLGTASFWEGVDVVGEALSLLVITRLPFAVPDDPIFKTRSELYDDPFSQYAVPLAVLRFKQGFGRLIRRKTDRGVMAVLDGRICSRTYGQTFLRSLPSCGLERARVRELPGLAAAWLGRDP
jgi:DNA polymerase-3 subunit epsilon/ATP-dependent DNA helicase DinG